MKAHIIYQLAKRDFQAQYRGTMLGFVWMYLQPLLFIAVLYAVFTMGFRDGLSHDMPFSLYLVCGMVAWQYISSNLSSHVGVFREYDYLVKKREFDLRILPVVKLMSALPTHVFLLLVAVALILNEGMVSGVAMLQLVYYWLAMSLLLFAVGLVTASLLPFVRDVSRVVSIIVLFGFWLTPIFWNIRLLPEHYQSWLQLNPAYYIVSGYRDSLVTGRWFWERGYESLVFWCVTIALLFLGLLLFRRLRPHLAEVI